MATNRAGESLKPRARFAYAQPIRARFYAPNVARKYPDEAYAYIQARAIAEIPGAQIARELQNGDVSELGPLPITIRQVQQLAARFKREHEQSGVDLEDATEDAIQSELRLLLAETKRRRKAASQLPATDPNALKLLKLCAETMTHIRRHLPSDKDPKAIERGEKTGTQTPTLDRLAGSLEPASRPLDLTETPSVSHYGSEANPDSPAQESTLVHALG